MTAINLSRNPIVNDQINTINEKLQYNYKEFMNYYINLNESKIKKIGLIKNQFFKLEKELDTYKILKEEGSLKNDNMSTG